VFPYKYFCDVNCSIPELTVPLVNFPAIVATSVAILQSQGMHDVK